MFTNAFLGREHLQEVLSRNGQPSGKLCDRREFDGGKRSNVLRTDDSVCSCDGHHTWLEEAFGLEGITVIVAELYLSAQTSCTDGRALTQQI